MAANALCQPCETPKFGQRQVLLGKPQPAGLCSIHTIKSPKTVPPPNPLALSPARGAHRRCPRARLSCGHRLAPSGRKRMGKEQETGKPGEGRTRLRQPPGPSPSSRPRAPSTGPSLSQPRGQPEAPRGARRWRCSRAAALPRGETETPQASPSPPNSASPPGIKARAVPGQNGKKKKK